MGRQQPMNACVRDKLKGAVRPRLRGIVALTIFWSQVNGVVARPFHGVDLYVDC